MTMEEIDARMEAYNECLAHLEQNWTDVSVERKQGEILAGILRKQSDLWYRNQTKRINKMRPPTNIPLKNGFTQVCVWPATCVGDKSKQAKFINVMKEEFGVHVQYLEEIETRSDENGPGGRNDLFFAIRTEDVSKFAVPRLEYGIRWVEDVYAKHQGHLYPERIAEYKSWDVASEYNSEDDEN